MIFGSRAEISGSGNFGATFEFQKSKMAAGGHLGYRKMTITSQPVCDRRDVWFQGGFLAEFRFFR